MAWLTREDVLMRLDEDSVIVTLMDTWMKHEMYWRGCESDDDGGNVDGGHKSMDNGGDGDGNSGNSGNGDGNSGNSDGNSSNSLVPRPSVCTEGGSGEYSTKFLNTAEFRR